LNINELITKLGNDKYKNVSSNLEFITECGVEDSDHRDMLKDALEYLSILEEGMQLLCTLNMERKQSQIKSLICEYKNLESKSEWLWKKGALDKYEATIKQMNDLENSLKVNYNYDIMRGCVNDDM
jgi:hypothetical protein